MATTTTPQRTDFSLDVVGRYVCNGWDEAMASQDATQFPGARPFDLIVIGGGSFGAAFASHAFHSDRAHGHRILVLEAGPFVFAEHVQNLPPQFWVTDVSGVWSKDVWNANSPQSFNRQFPGLAFCVGGRSVFWGGWAPYLTESELASPLWPPNVVNDLTRPVLNVAGRGLSYLDHAGDQIGINVTNDFILDALHQELRRRLFGGLQARVAVAPVLAGNRGVAINAAAPANAINTLEAPLAVQSATRPGFFPFNKFNGVQLLIRAARLAQSEAESVATGTTGQINALKRIMIVDNTHVIRLEFANRRVVRVHTNQGALDVAPGARVLLALGTIENTRLALVTLPNQNGQIGTNLMAHLRTNVTVRIRRADIPALAGIRGLEVSALFVKGIHTFADQADGVTRGHFHVQITASAVGELSTDSEAQLFKKIPNIDELDRFSDLNASWIVVTFRGVGEMFGERVPVPGSNRVILDTMGPTQVFDYGQPRALVSLDAGPAGGKHLELWDVMDNACIELARMMAVNARLEFLNTDDTRQNQWWDVNPPSVNARRDPLSNTHHETGTLRMGANAAGSVTDEYGQFWEADNLYVLGPAQLPLIGSPNPMLTNVALAMRTADRILSVAPGAAAPLAVQAPRPAAPEPNAPFPEADFATLFDGSERTFGNWQLVGGRPFALIDGEMVAQEGPSMGLLYHAAQNFGDFILRLEFLLPNPTTAGTSRTDNDNSGVFIRFRDPKRPVPRRGNPGASDLFVDKTWVAVFTGFEVQIDEDARGNKTLNPPEPDGMDKKRTGCLYDIPTVVDPNAIYQQFQRGAPIKAGEWNLYEIQVINNRVTVFLNGRRTTSYFNPDNYRGQSNALDPFSGYIGVQSHTGRVRFRNIRIKTQNLPAAPQA
jgi:hypothetical protein